MVWLFCTEVYIQILPGKFTSIRNGTADKNHCCNWHSLFGSDLFRLMSLYSVHRRYSHCYRSSFLLPDCGQEQQIPQYGTTNLLPSTTSIYCTTWPSCVASVFPAPTPPTLLCSSAFFGFASISLTGQHWSVALLCQSKSWRKLRTNITQQQSGRTTSDVASSANLSGWPRARVFSSRFLFLCTDLTCTGMPHVDSVLGWRGRISSSCLWPNEDLYFCVPAETKFLPGSWAVTEVKTCYSVCHVT